MPIDDIPFLLGNGYTIVDIFIFWRGYKLSKLKGSLSEAATKASVLSSDIDDPIIYLFFVLLKIVPISSSSIISLLA